MAGYIGSKVVNLSVSAAKVAGNIIVTGNVDGRDVSVDGANLDAVVTAAGLNTAKTGITSSQASAITANTAKTGITSSQASAITANTAKTGITSSQASAITANTAKVSNVDHPVVSKAVPANAVFTDTIFDTSTLGTASTQATGAFATAAQGTKADAALPLANANSNSDTHLNISTATTGQYLSWSGTDYAWATVVGATDGGSAASVYTSTQTINGGSASG
jgi:hypothetical protein